MVSLLGKDWNVVAVTFERANLYRINGNRGKGGDAVKMRDNASRHARTIYWAVFDQKGRLLQGEPGPGKTLVPAAELERIVKEVATNESVKSVLASLQGGKMPTAAKIMELEAVPSAPGAVEPKATTYRLIVAMGDADEFEASLKIVDAAGKLTGELVSPDGDIMPIRKTQLEGNRLSFETNFGSAKEPVKLRFDGEIAGNTIRGTLS